MNMFNNAGIKFKQTKISVFNIHLEKQNAQK